MAYLHPIEATTDKINEISISDGNLIFDILGKKIHFDSHYGERIEITSIEFFDTETELLNSTGIPNKLFIAKDSNAIYYYDGDWKSIKINSGEQTVTKFYLSETGSDDNSGITEDAPMQTLIGLMKKYPNNNIFNITISGNIPASDEGTITIKDKTFYIIGTDNTSDILNDTLIFAHCFISFSSVTVKQLFGYDDTSCVAKNCNVKNNVYFADNSTLTAYSSTTINGNVEALNNSILTIRDSSITGSLSSSYGAVITMNNSTYNGTYTINGGRIYIDSAVDVSTQETIDSSSSTIDVLDSEPSDAPVGYMYIVST